MASSLRKPLDDGTLPLVPVAQLYQGPDMSRMHAQEIRSRLLAVQLPSPPQTLL
jgi:hypothetical protein